jgi:4-methylaminobutanoate oxidase (formaldehyde-forming)
VTPETTPLEAGLEFAIRWDKPGGFIGREALERQRERGPDRRLRCLVLDDPTEVVLGGEPVRAADRVLGRITSGGYGHTVDRSLAYAYLPVDAAQLGRRVHVEIFGRHVGAAVVDDPVFDPTGARIRGNYAQA